MVSAYYVNKDSIGAHLQVVFVCISYQLPIENINITKCFLCIIGSAFMLFGLFRDYSSFFSAHYDLCIYFTDQEVEKVIARLNRFEVRKLRLDPQWHDSKDKYLRKLQDTVTKKINDAFPFADESDSIHSNGSTDFHVKRNGFWHKYKIEKANGLLIHTYETPDAPKKELKSEFILKETASNHISLNVLNVLCGTIIIRPVFKQVVWLTPTNELYHHDLIAATKIRFFPFPQVAETIYLIQENRKTTMTPIGIAYNTETS